MKTNKIKQRVAILAMAILLSSITFAQAHQNRHVKQGGIIPELSVEQKEKIAELKVEHMQNMTEYKAKAKLIKAEIELLSVAQKADLDKIYAKIDALSEVRTVMAKEKSKLRQEIRSLLNDKQRASFDARGGRKFKRNPHGHHHGAHGQNKTKGRYMHQSPGRG